MRVAIFHQFLDNIGGAEKVVLTLGRELKGDIFTTNINKEKISQMGFGDVIKKIFSIGKVPIRPPFRQQLAFNLFSKLKLDNKYDFYIIAGDWAISGAKNNHPNLWYSHSGLNEIWGFQDEIEKKILKFWQIIPYRAWIKYLRSQTKTYVKAADNIACNSLNTRNKIEKYYKRNAEIIYPPIETSSFYPATSQNYWLAVNRLIPHKRIEIQIEAFRFLPQEKLIIVGSYEKGVYHMEKYKKYLISIKPKNVEIKHWVSDKELKELYSKSKGLIATSFNEDFGMNAIEAMAAGKPVIAPNKGGYKESIIDGKTGILIKDLNSFELIKAINEVNNNIKINPLYYRDFCIKRAKEFDTSIFIKKIKKIINQS